MGTTYLPFEVGQLVELRCFLIGYRGAWFQCKIKDIGWRMGCLSYELEFVDFPDEKVVWTKPFQKPPTAFGIPCTGSRGQLMIRPQFPHVNSAKLSNKWKVGDLVDWWKDNCYWSGKIIAISGPKDVKIELLPPPFGEGLTYNASCKDLRPSLDWSPESGWTVPTIEVSGSAQCAQVLGHVNEDSTAQKLSGEGNDNQATAKRSQVSSASQPAESSGKRKDGSARTLKRTHADLASKKHRNKSATNADLDHFNGVSRKMSSLAKMSSSPAQDASTAEECDEDWSLEKIIPEIPLNSMQNDSMEAAIVDLEELINRIKWIKGIVDFGRALPNASGSSWKFLEPRPSSAPE